MKKNIKSIGVAVLAGLTCFAEEPVPAVPPPLTMSYGPHERNVLDLWQAEGDSPRPLLLYIHGGGWLNGDKSRIHAFINVTNWLAKGVSVASANYRYSSIAPLPAPVHDAARALQFLRYKAGELNLDPARVALQGGSAGGCSVLWLLFHDDLADPASADPVLRESTRVQGCYANFPQTSIDPVVVNEWIGELAASHGMLVKSVGADDYNALMNNYAQHKPLLDEFSPINHVDANDPPVFLSYTADMKLPPDSRNAAIHHGMFGVKLKEYGESAGYNRVRLQISNVMDADITPTQFLESVLLEK